MYSWVQFSAVMTSETVFLVIISQQRRAVFTPTRNSTDACVSSSEILTYIYIYIHTTVYTYTQRYWITPKFKTHLPVARSTSHLYTRYLRSFETRCSSMDKLRQNRYGTGFFFIFFIYNLRWKKYQRVR